MGVERGEDEPEKGLEYHDHPGDPKSLRRVKCVLEFDMKAGKNNCPEIDKSKQSKGYDEEGYGVSGRECFRSYATMEDVCADGDHCQY